MSAVLFLNLFLRCQARFTGLRNDERRAVFVQPIDITPVNLAENLAKDIDMNPGPGSSSQEVAAAVEDIVAALVIEDKHHPPIVLVLVVILIAQEHAGLPVIGDINGLPDCFASAILQCKEELAMRLAAIGVRNHPADTLKLPVKADVDDDIVHIANRLNHFPGSPAGLTRSGPSSNHVNASTSVHKICAQGTPSIVACDLGGEECVD